MPVAEHVDERLLLCLLLLLLHMLLLLLHMLLLLLRLLLLVLHEREELPVLLSIHLHVHLL